MRVVTRWWSTAVAWVRRRDPNGRAIKRSVRAAVVLPVAFGLTHTLFSDAQVSLLAGFGSFALLLLVEFPGQLRTRAASYGALFLVGAALISLGTVLSQDKVAAVIGMAVVGFAVLYVGIGSSVAAAASTATLLTFVLPVAVSVPASEVGDRLLGWCIAGALCIPTCLLVWPPPPDRRLRQRLSTTIAAMGALVDAHSDGRRDPAARAALDQALASMREYLARTVYPQSGAALRAATLGSLVGRVEWAARSALVARDEALTLGLPSVRAVLAAAASCLRFSAALVDPPRAGSIERASLVGSTQTSALRLVDLVETELGAEVAGPVPPPAGEGDRAAAPLLDAGGTGDTSPRGLVDPTFHARALGIAAAMVADTTLEAAGARPIANRMDDEVAVQSRQLAKSLRSHLSPRSVWFRNAVRGAAGLAGAVAVVEVTNVEHGFWVVLGTLSVLRSSALATGSTALRAVAGTTAGFVLGSLIMLAVGGHTLALWLLLPIAVLVAGTAPSLISFAAGQAGFTVFVVVLFNIIVPSGWRVGLTRIEDVAIGCAVSILVGLLFWPRGATAALGRALSDAFAAASRYLTKVVDELTTPGGVVDTSSAKRDAQSAYLRLDDTFRQFLGERGAKVVPIDTISSLFTGANRVRMAAVTMASLPHVDSRDGGALESVAVAGAVLRDAFATSDRWYGEFAELLADRRGLLDPPPVQDATLHHVLQSAFDDAWGRQRDDQVRAVRQMAWAEELLGTERAIQSELAAASGSFRQRRRAGLIV